MYKEYLTEFWHSAKALENSKVYFSTPTSGIYGEVGVNTFRNAIGAHYLPHSSEYVTPAFIDIVRPWFETIGYGEAVPIKGTLKKSFLPPRWRLLMAQIIQFLGGKTRGFDQITNKDVIMLYSLANEINIDYASIFWEYIINKLNKKHREKVVRYTRFLSLLMMHKMKEGYRDGEFTIYPTQVFSVNNLVLKPNQPKEPPFTDQMLEICAADTLVVFKAPKPSSNAERVPQGTKPGAKPGHKKHSTSLKQSSVSSKEATKGGSSKVPTSSKTSLSNKRKESSSAMDSNLGQPPISTPVDTGMHKEDQQATSKADPVNSAHSDFVPQQQGMNKGTNNTSYDHLFTGTDPHVLVDQTKYISEGLETILTRPIIGKGANLVARQIKEKTSTTIKLEDLAKLVTHVQPSFKDLDSPEDDPVIVVDDTNKDVEDEIHAATNDETEDTSVPKSSS
nr:hypothetical protein [Tanacetum cinerariifolium]